MEEQYKIEKAQLTELELRFEPLDAEFKAILEERDVAYRARLTADRETNRRQQAALALQAWWRSYRVRKACMLAAKKRAKKAGKGKRKEKGGKKGKKKGEEKAEEKPPAPESAENAPPTEPTDTTEPAAEHAQWSFESLMQGAGLQVGFGVEVMKISWRYNGTQRM